MWSGGDINRPGTIRLHSDKFRNQPNYFDGDVISIVVDMNKKNLTFYVNNEFVSTWRGIIKNPCRPFYITKCIEYIKLQKSARSSIG